MTTREHRPGIRVSADFVAAHPGADPSATEVSINLVFAAELLFGRMDALGARSGLSRGGFNLLQVLAGSDEPLTPTEIGERLVVKGATVTGLVDTLLRRGWVERAPHPNDRRRVLVSVTEEGRALLAQANDVLLARDKVWMACFTENERDRLVRLLGKLQDHLQALPPED